MTNLIDPLSRISANLSVLLELDAQGDWQHSPLVRIYREGTYDLTDAQVIQLDHLLGAAVHNLQFAKPYKQIELFG